MKKKILFFSSPTSCPLMMVSLAIEDFSLDLDSVLLRSVFSCVVRSKQERPRLLQMRLHWWEWKNRAMPLVPRLPSP